MRTKKQVEGRGGRGGGGVLGIGGANGKGYVWLSIQYSIGVKGRAKGRVRSERDNRRPMKKGIDSGEALRVTQ